MRYIHPVSFGSVPKIPCVVDNRSVVINAPPSFKFHKISYINNLISVPVRSGRKIHYALYSFYFYIHKPILIPVKSHYVRISCEIGRIRKSYILAHKPSVFVSTRIVFYGVHSVRKPQFYHLYIRISEREIRISVHMPFRSLFDIQIYVISVRDSPYPYLSITTYL